MFIQLSTIHLFDYLKKCMFIQISTFYFMFLFQKMVLGRLDKNGQKRIKRSKKENKKNKFL
jgi:hypothetical protein